MNKYISVFVISIIFSIFSCSEQKSDSSISFENLPELPLADLTKNGELTHSLTEPILTIAHPKFVKPENPNILSDTTALHICPASSYTKSWYLTQVTYPKVICYPNNVPTDQVIKNAVAQQSEIGIKKESTTATPLPQKRYYKLSSLNNEIFANPLFCTVFGGPWSANVTRTTSCGCTGRQLDMWTLEVPSFPELYLQWYGQWEDIPADIYPELGIIVNDLYEKNTATLCCPGYTTCPDQFGGTSCVDFTLCNSFPN